MAAREVLVQLELDLLAGEKAVEHAIACVASLAEALLAQDFAVALHSHGLLLGPSRGGRAAEQLLRGCAQLNPRRPLPAVPQRLRHLAVVGLVGPGVRGGGGHRLRLPAA